jgi:hypothetical protein
MLDLIAPPELAPARAAHAATMAGGGQPLTVTLTIRPGAALADHDPVHLDNLLARCLVDAATAGRGLPPLDGHGAYDLPVPLRCLWRDPDGLPMWACTPLLPEGAAAADAIYWHKRRQTGLMTRGGGKDGRFSIASTDGRWMERRTPVPARLAERFVARAIGDGDAILALLRAVTHVGKHRARGLGEVETWAVAPAADFPLVRDGVLTRPLPVGALALLGDLAPDVAPAPVGWTPPQWAPHLFRPGWWPGTPVVPAAEAWWSDR